MTNLVRSKIHLSELREGMTVEINGQLITVNKNDIKKDEFMGFSFRGDSSKKIITRVQFLVPTAFGNVLR